MAAPTTSTSTSTSTQLAASNFLESFQFGDDAKGPRVAVPVEDVRAWLAGLNVSEADMTPGYMDACRHIFIKNPFPTILPESVPICDDLKPYIKTSKVARVPDEEPVLLSTVNLSDLPAGSVKPASVLDLILYRADFLHKENETKGRPAERVADADWYVVMIKGQDEMRELPMKVETLQRNLKDGATIKPEMWDESTAYWSKRVELRA